MLPAVSPAVLKGNTPKAFNRISAVFDKNLLSKVVAVDTAKNHVIIARYFPDYSNLHFQVYNKDCKMTDTFVLTRGQDDGNICVQKYSAYRNKVMRKR